RISRPTAFFSSAATAIAIASSRASSLATDAEAAAAAEGRVFLVRGPSGGAFAAAGERFARAGRRGPACGLVDACEERIRGRPPSLPLAPPLVVRLSAK